MGSDVGLPYGFVIDGPSTSTLPDGFVIDDQKKTSALEDVGRTILPSLARGVAGVIATPRTMRDLVDAGADWVSNKVGIPMPDQETIDKYRNNPMRGPKYETVKGGIEALTGQLYEPTTRAGKVVNTVGEFVPAALMGGGGTVRNIVNYAVAPGVASELAGWATEGTKAEPWARVGGALAGGISAGMLNRPTVAGNVLKDATRGATRDQFIAAEALFNEAQQAGVPITRAEAMQHVTSGATRLGDVQRVVEGQGGMRDFFSHRPSQVDNAARGEFDRIAQQSQSPSTIGPAVGGAAESTINDVRGAINRQTAPLYNQATSQRIDPVTFSQVSSDPVFQLGLSRVRSDPYIGPTLRGLPDDSVAVIDAIKKQLDETGRNLRDPMSGTARNNYAASIVEGGNRRMVAAADAATGSSQSAGIAGSYETARNIQEDLRKRYLDPVMNGPLGKIASKDTTTHDAINALFPQNPLPGSANEISTAVSALSLRRPEASRQLVRAHAESVFNEATQNLQSGAAEFGGAKFAAVIRGNPQQAQNLEAAVRALPGGDRTWTGFDNFLNILEAQGTRQRIGSQTAFNTEALAALKNGGAASEAASVIGGLGMKWPQRVKDTIDAWRLGRNVDQLAYLLTNPAAAKVFRELATSPGDARASSLIARLAAISDQGKKNPVSDSSIK